MSSLAIRTTHCNNGVPNMLVVFGGDLDANSAQVLLQVLGCLRARVGEEIRSLGHDPSEDDLGRGGAFLGCQLLEDLDQVQILREVLGTESRQVSTTVFLFQIVEGLVPARQESSPEG